mmetsp:Transcript_37122/g.106950  ORF Transcript_37122/g.106950 Transcript_37122/m.106950 type:complete len:367 (+) Transcript_37122:467-1567(+)
MRYQRYHATARAPARRSGGSEVLATWLSHGCGAEEVLPRRLTHLRGRKEPGHGPLALQARALVGVHPAVRAAAATAASAAAAATAAALLGRAGWLVYLRVPGEAALGGRAPAGAEGPPALGRPAGPGRRRVEDPTAAIPGLGAGPRGPAAAAAFAGAAAMEAADASRGGPAGDARAPRRRLAARRAAGPGHPRGRPGGGSSSAERCSAPVVSADGREPGERLAGQPQAGEAGAARPTLRAVGGAGAGGPGEEEGAGGAAGGPDQGRRGAGRDPALRDGALPPAGARVEDGRGRGASRRAGAAQGEGPESAGGRAHTHAGWPVGGLDLPQPVWSWPGPRVVASADAGGGGLSARSGGRAPQPLLQGC